LRGTVDVTVAGERVGTIVYDAVLLPDPELVRAAGRVIALAVERERLTAELLAGRAALRESRARIVESGDRERRRLARDLHDGLQAQLVVLALRAGQLAARTAPPLAEQAAALCADAKTAIAELRGVVQGILPDLLVQRGLYAAAEELLDRLPLPSTLTVPDDGAALPASLETAGYFTLAEGLSNAVKHAQARKLWVALARDDTRLTIEVRDDGVGGAHLDGGGLRGIADRVEALGGRLHLDSPRGRGTCLRVELPCES
jgi:signal transduction histidine kinase